MNTRSSQLYGVGLDAEVRRIQMKIQMNIVKKNDGLSLRNMLSVFKLNDKEACGSVDMDVFTKSLKQYG
jgi:hypothetical protein